MSRVVGILGGMGPQATIDLMDKIVEATPARDEAEHVHMIVDSNPAVPPRTKALLEGGRDPGPELARMAQRLEAAGADLLAMPCNTAHAFAERIRAAVGIPLLDMIDLAVEEVPRAASGATAVGLCATRGTRRTRLYHDRFRARGVEVIDLDEDAQVILDALIESVKTEPVTPERRAAMRGVLDRLVARGADVIVVGCTEVPMLMPEHTPARVIDPTDVLARTVVSYCTQEPPEPGGALSDVPTPALVVDVERLEANLRRAQRYAESQGVVLRPHAKTHKSPEIARRQIELGAEGICVAKLGEAEVMIDAGIDDVFMANTVAGGDQARRAAALAQRARFAIGADHPAQLEALSMAAREEAHPLEVMIEVDSGAGRGGAAPEHVGALLQRVRALPGLTARGLYTYEGYTYGARDAADLAARHREAQQLMVRLADENAASFEGAPVVSMGSTPSLLAEVELLEGITEFRPGTYVFLDAAQAALAGGPEHCAAHVLATVTSVLEGRAVLDAGSKTLTSDARAKGVTATQGHGLLVDHGLTLTRLSEEHGVIEAAGAERLEVGQRVRVLPNHICPVVNLFRSLHLVREGRLERTLPVAARGRLD